MSNSELDAERDYVAMLYAHLDEQRAHAGTRLRETLAERGTNQQQRSQRDAASAMYSDAVAQYDSVENGLCFGRLDFAGDDFTGGTVPFEVPRYIGRIGLRADGHEEPLLVDWRADAARPFYLATVATPQGVSRRRHLTTKGREVIAIADEALDAGAAAFGETGTGDVGLVGESALLGALTAQRTGRMRDIVETIQTEQDEIIRARHTGVLVVEGGPGTGKTAVALHRAAYLLYQHRETLATRAVLVVGPNATFLRYIGRVLPGLGETAAVLASVGDLFPGVTATVEDTDAVAEVKGRAAMADILAAAVADRQRVPDEPYEVDFDRDIAFDRDTVTFDETTVAAARDRARASGLAHNPARRVFTRHLVDALAAQVADKVGADLFGGPNLLTPGDLAVIRDELRESAAVTAAVDALWPELTPQQLLRDLYADPLALEIAAPDLTAAERRLLHRDPAAPFTVSDVPLLDEAAELLGTDDTYERAAAVAGAARDRAYAEGVLDILARDVFDDDDEILMAADLIDSHRLAERHVESDGLTVAERAAADRRWAYGHIIVDEAQELSPMAWRLVMRRSPSRSMTLVGDTAQTGDPAGTTSWAATLKPYVADRWRLDRLSVNYRTPAEIMTLAARVLRHIDPDRPAPTSIRSTGVAPWTRRTGDLAADVRAAVTDERGHVGGGRIAVIAPPGRLDEVRAALPDAATGAAADLTSPVVVLTVRQAKGLEFDSVLVVDPAGILDGSARGANDLYVALTRATARLGILYDGDLPDALSG